MNNQLQSLQEVLCAKAQQMQQVHSQLLIQLANVQRIMKSHQSIKQKLLNLGQVLKNFQSGFKDIARLVQQLPKNLFSIAESALTKELTSFQCQSQKDKKILKLQRKVGSLKQQLKQYRMKFTLMEENVKKLQQKVAGKFEVRLEQKLRSIQQSKLQFQRSLKS